jgi:hypothetical protein
MARAKSKTKGKAKRAATKRLWTDLEIHFNAVAGQAATGNCENAYGHLVEAATIQGTLAPTPKKMERLVEKTWYQRLAAFRNFGRFCLRPDTRHEQVVAKVPVMMFPKK